MQLWVFRAVVLYTFPILGVVALSTIVVLVLSTRGTGAERVTTVKLVELGLEVRTNEG